jgi:hypothetical protein
VKSSCIKKVHPRIAGAGYLIAVLLGLAALYSIAPADAADGRPTRAQASRVDRSAMPMSPRGVIERRQVIVERRLAPQAGGIVVLRGSRSAAYPNLNPPGPNLTGPSLNGAGYGSSRAAGPLLLPSAGWDRELDYGGLDYGGSAPLVVTSP